jgi:hypothetical protein
MSSLETGDEDELSRYVDKFISSPPVLNGGEHRDVEYFRALLDLLSLKIPAVRILKIFQPIDNYLISVLGVNTSMKRCKSCISGAFSAESQLIQHDVASGDHSQSIESSKSIDKFDVVIISPVSHPSIDKRGYRSWLIKDIR